jgi:hypothetical protein
MWLDAADASTIVLNGSTVSQWSDKSGNGRHAVQATAANQPAWGRGRNLLLWSEDLTHSAWVKRGTCVVTPNDAIAPDGTLTADRVSGLSPSGLNDFYNADYFTTTRGTAGAAYTPTVYLKRISTSGIVSVQNPINGITNGRWDIDLSQLPDAWVRITATTPGVTVNNPFTLDSSGRGGFLLNCTTGGPVAVHVWGTQLNPGTTPDTYQRTEATAFTVATGINGLPALDFGVGQMLSNANMPIDDPVSLFAVASSPGSSAGEYRAMMRMHRFATASSHGFIGSLGGDFATFFGDGSFHAGWNDFLANTPAASVATNKVLAVVNAGAQAAPWVDGVAQNNKVGTMGAATGYDLGASNTASNQNWRGPVAEIVMLPSAVSNADRQRIEGYLAHKWWGSGAANTLPADHPFKNVPPTV